MTVTIVLPQGTHKIFVNIHDVAANVTMASTNLTSLELISSVVTCVARYPEVPCSNPGFGAPIPRFCFAYSGQSAPEDCLKVGHD
jgi:hypothetical protein